MGEHKLEQVVLDFWDKKFDVLVCTTIVETGLDISNANTLIVERSDVLGLSQLHQLRGRVGRGGLPGLCLLVSHAEQGSPAMDRLTAVAGTTDGFELSRVDLEQRREGDVLGASQSGLRSGLDSLRVLRDEETIVAARAEAEDMVAADPALGRWPLLAAEVDEWERDRKSEFMERS
jgi:ATP-dependent DNA helicase RecG